MKKKTAVVKHHYPLKYEGNLILFILSILLFFPIAIVLAMKNGAFIRNDKYYAFSYHGSYGWLIFWTLILFPIAIILVLINGVDVVEEKRMTR
ncbi:MAG: hypothetical protein ACD_16C00176G0007 [uncultured bacterium]|nr:MAG: hypothetical protein ACD_16C00176G0007 [uncultured bacterium]OFW68872.1 MAG: hypothetical protein A2X70_01220 [Alphaproteobacteria bacterium GWC2_42_16]OFW73616.1 MAG: hypothetical protein A2Z80_00365 [Alphaproteobacteria bacterium GWA2_41_27]OFW81930.1 MAG: hypothetical protein A3E50_01635 [Alphaproteobacteria bacterium RIFCSPHIGHO2_12_FULL_42_100]OFW84948.1 MAG: hypothetical protein A2W06_06695 [Alphaproteobacteria bacterium RBG_16_42_14]OFW91061.1 MAG: hypothetical protein A3C41_070